MLLPTNGISFVKHASCYLVRSSNVKLDSTTKSIPCFVLFLSLVSKTKVKQKIIK